MKKCKLNTPVSFFIFNRPDLTKIVFESIRKVKPRKLLVVADGARFPEETKKCTQARAVIQQVDWDCEILTNFSDINLGCKKRVSSGLDWVFEHVEETIILEDDCLPTESFFYFCQELLEYYRDDKRIMHIGGNNYPNNHGNNNDSYFFSKYTLIWGWATWKRAWNLYDVDLKKWTKEKLEKIINYKCIEQVEKEFRYLRFQQVFSQSLNTWDSQWLYSCWGQNGLAILPKYNLVSNIGFRNDATHTLVKNKVANIPTKDIWEITHPEFIFPDVKADAYLFDHWFDGITLKNNRKLINRLINKTKSSLEKIKQIFLSKTK